MTPHLLGRCVTEEQRQLRNLQMSASGNAALPRPYQTQGLRWAETSNVRCLPIFQ